MNIPVVFYHLGNDDYFHSAVEIALLNNRVIHIGDHSISSHHDYEFVDVRTCDDNVNDFLKCYEHMHPRVGLFEHICFIRWIALRNLMNSKNINFAFYADSDLAVLCNVDEKFNELGRPPVAFSISENTHTYRWAACGHNSFWSSDKINDIVDFIFFSYRNEKMKSLLREKFQWHIKTGTPGGVCDMTVFYHYHLRNEVLPINKIFNNQVFDDNINDPDNFAINEFDFTNGLKKIVVKDKQFFVIKNDKLIQLNSIHFQGNAKNLIFQINDILRS